MNTVRLIGMGLAALGLAAAAAVAQTAPRDDSTREAPALKVPAPYTGPTVYTVDIIAQYPHDSTAFTQGLLWHDGALYESTGRVGQSRVRKVDLASGKVLLDSPIPEWQFGEGIALWGDQFVSLTWQDGAVHRWKRDDLSPISSVDDFPFEGWGITTGDDGLIFSDGSETLRVLDPETLEVRRTVNVTLNGRPLRLLNELEMVDGLVFANVWQSPYIVAIDPATGEVRKLIDLRSIVEQVPVRDYGAVLNGIAWDAENRRLFITGKLWPSLFEIRLIETDAQVR
jgi:glutamine cyclotransferase